MSNAAMRVARRIWNVGIRLDLVEANPFAKMELEKTGGNTRPVERAEVEAFCNAADKSAWPEIGTAAAMAFEWCQREGDVIGTIGWPNYEAGLRAKVRQHKTSAWVWLPLRDKDGPFFPELEARLATTAKLGTLIIMRSDTKRAKGVHKPYDEHLFRKRFRKIKKAAGLPTDFTMMACRHGGLQELSDAEATDREMVAMSGHTDPKMLAVYTKRSGRQAANASRKRRAWRTQAAQESERPQQNLSE